MTLSHLANTYLEEHPSAAARVLASLPTETILSTISELTAKTKAHCLQTLAPSVASECLEQLPAEEISAILKELPVGSAAVLARRLSRELRTDLLHALPPTYGTALRIALRYPITSVGSRVDPNTVVVHADTTIADAIRLGRRNPGALRKYLYLIDEQHRLVGVVDVRQCLVSQRRRDPIGTLSAPDVIALKARSSVERARGHPGWKRFAMLPVVDRNDVLLGVVRARDIVDTDSSEAASENPASVMDVALDIAQVYWDTSSEIFLPSSPNHAEPSDEQAR